MRSIRGVSHLCEIVVRSIFCSRWLALYVHGKSIGRIHNVSDDFRPSLVSGQ